MLGSALWDGSEPKIVIVRNSKNEVCAGCNFQEIRTIMAHAETATEKYHQSSDFHQRSRLAALESLVVSGHNIASDGFQHVLDGRHCRG